MNKEKVEQNKASENEINEYIDNTVNTFKERLKKSDNFIGKDKRKELIKKLSDVLNDLNNE